MKRWIAFLVSLVMAVTLAVPALAAESPSGVEEKYEVVKTDPQLPDGWRIEQFDPEKATNAVQNSAIAELINKINSGEAPASVQDLLLSLFALDALAQEGDSERTEELKEMLEALKELDLPQLDPEMVKNAEQNPYIAELISKLQEGETPVSVEDLIWSLIVINTEGDEDAEMQAEKQAEKIAELLEALKDFDFITFFEEIGITDGKVIRFTLPDGSDLASTVKAQIDALRGEDDVSDYMFLIINPETGRYAFIPVDRETFESETGTVIIDLPMLGSIALLIANDREENLVKAVDSIETSVTLPDGWWIEVRYAAPHDDKTDVSSDEEEKVNDPLTIETPQEVVAALLGIDLNDEASLATLSEDQRALLMKLGEYEFVSDFFDVVMTNGVTSLFTDPAGNRVSVRVSFLFDGLEDLDLSEYRFLVVDLTNNVFELQPVIKEEGKEKVDMSTLGGLALIRPISK